MTPHNFGDKIKIAAGLTRHRFGAERKWMRNVYAEPKDAVFIIKRTFANGKVETNNYGYDEGIDRYFEAKEYLAGAIVGIKGVGVGKILLSDIVKETCPTCGK